MITPSLNTLAFPDWTLEQVASFANDHQVRYFEIRGLENTLDLLSLPNFSDPLRLEQSLRLLKHYQVQVLSLNLGYRLAEMSDTLLAAVPDYARLAEALGAPYLRFFAGGSLARAEERAAMTANAIKLLEVLSPFKVTCLLETHDSLVHSEHVLELVETAGSRSKAKLGVLWDIAHTINLGQESWQYTLARLKPYIAYLHIKDGFFRDGELQDSFLFEGTLPVREILTHLKEEPLTYIVSFEWEKLWHPHLPPGDLASKDFLEKIWAL